MDMKKLGWIGTGKMGAPMSKRLLKAGYGMYVCDVERANAESLIAMGATFVPTPKELAQKVDIIFSMIPNPAVLKEIVSGADGLAETIKKGSIYIDMSTVDAETSAGVNAVIEEKGAKFIRACVTGSVAYAEAGTLGGLNSGDPKAYEAVLPILKVLTDRQYYLGMGEEARYMKIIINMMLGTSMQAMAESLVMGRAVGIDWELMVDAIADSAAACPAVRFKRDMFKTRDFNPMSKAEIMDKDMDIALDIARKNKLAVPLASIARQMYSSMGPAGRFELDYAAVLLQNEDLNGMPWE
jgi:3-hydroxyisobutyrate dehydrogenase-like beta-hydroxyacid dehydrogenase